MTGALKPLLLLRDVKDATLDDADTRDYDPGLYRTIGNVTFSILPRRKEPQLRKFVLEKSIPTIVARKLADLSPVDSLFTFEPKLEDILEVRADWPFKPKHSQILAADILAGVSSLHDGGLQRNRFGVADILLVCRDNRYFFQIAGLEDCTCINGREPTNSEGFASFFDTMKFVDERIESFSWIQDFVRGLGRSSTLGSTSIGAASRRLPADVDLLRRELEFYLLAVRIFCTTLGGNTADRQEARRSS